MLPPDEPPWTDLSNALLRDHLLAWTDYPDPDELAALVAGVPDTGAARKGWQDFLDQPSLLAGLRLRLGLTPTEVDVLAMLLTCETTARTAHLCGVGQGLPDQALPSLSLLATLFGPEGGVPAVGPGSGLHRGRLVRMTDGPLWHLRQVGLEPGVLWAIAGDQALDPELPAGGRMDRGIFFDGTPGPLIAVSGADVDSRAARIREITGPVNTLTSPVPETERQWSALIREATLSASVVVLEVTAGAIPAEGNSFIAAARHLQWALSSPDRLSLQDAPQIPGVGHHLEPVRLAVPDQGGELALTPTQRRLLELRGMRADSDAVDFLPYLRASRTPMAADRVIPRITLDDMVFTDDQRAELDTLLRDRTAAGAISEQWGFEPQRSLVLLQGPPGTGKTVTAEALAGSLGQELLKVNVAALVSKYIGETQKNFEQLFAILDELPSVLLIDEVDALFGKRTGVSSSNDRYANLETAYLLQRTERLSGVVVMTTNLTANIDPAFIRRFDVVLTFDSPKEPERLRLWERLLPKACPGRDEVDFDSLAADFDVTGAMINNAARRAGYDAAASGGRVTTELLRKAIQDQMRKHGWLSV